MAFWEHVNDGLKKYAKEGWDVVRGSAKIGKKRYHIHSLHKRAEKLFAEVGGIVYDMAKPPYENPLSHQEVLTLVEDIKKVEAEIASVEAEIAELKKKEPPSAEKSADTDKTGESTGPKAAEDTGKTDKDKAPGVD